MLGLVYKKGHAGANPPAQPLAFLFGAVIEDHKLTSEVVVTTEVLGIEGLFDVLLYEDKTTNNPIKKIIKADVGTYGLHTDIDFVIS